MGIRNKLEPPYPTSQAELKDYCDRFLAALKAHVGNHLVCLLLCGSWARGEAVPPQSDADLTVVVDEVNDEVLEGLRRAWEESDVGCANVYGADEVSAMAREALEMYTTNSVVLWGNNPFPHPTKGNFAADLAKASETVARDARSLFLYRWMTEEERASAVNSLLGKWGLHWAFKNLVAFRTGEFPKTMDEVRKGLAGTDEGEFLGWMETNPEAPAEDTARRLSKLAANWFKEIHVYLSDAKGA